MLHTCPRKHAIKPSKATTRVLLLLLMIMFGVSSGFAQALDTSFDPGSGPRAAGFVTALAVQVDGKILLGGGFSTYNGVSRNRIARVNTDGSLDVTFDPGSGASSSVAALAVQADGKVLLAGFFTTYNVVSRSRIARINTDGSLDASFNPGTGANNTVSALAVQADGKILLGGQFTRRCPACS